MQISQMMQTSVLVVDGIDSDRMRLQQMLEPRVQFDGVKTGGEALTYIKRNSVDLLLLSVKLPDMDGFELLRTLRADSRFEDLPVIMLSSEDSTSERIRLLEIGAVDYIVKPFNPMELKIRVKKILPN